MKDIVSSVTYGHILSYSFITRLLSESNETWHTSSTWASVAFDVFQKFRNTLTHQSENLKITVKLLLKYPDTHYSKWHLCLIFGEFLLF